jgi:hypothetical protein
MDAVTGDPLPDDTPDQAPSTAVAIGHVLQWASANPAVLGSMALAAITLVRIIRVAHGDVMSGRALLRYGGTTSVVISIMLELVPIVIAFATAVTCILVVKNRRLGTYFPPRALLVLLCLFSVSLNALGAGAFLGTFYVFHLRKENGGYSPALKGLTYLLILPILFNVAALDTVWLPTEELQTKLGREVAYVLKADSTEFVLLREDDREIYILDPSAVTQRNICSLQRGWVDSLFDRRIVDYLGVPGERRPHYDVCPRP